MFDLGIMNGKVYTGEYWYEGHLYIKDGKISALTQEKLICKNTYDAKGFWVLPGSDADIVILNPYKSWLPSTGIYQDVPMKGQVISTICRGKFIIDNGEFVGKMGYGNYFERELKID